MNQSCAERKGNREVRVSGGNRNLVVKEVNLLRSVQSSAVRSLGFGSTLNNIFSPSFLGKNLQCVCYQKKDSVSFPQVVWKVLRPSHRLSEIHLPAAVPILALQQAMYLFLKKQFKTGSSLLLLGKFHLSVESL